MRMTQKRKAVLAILEKTGQPMSAEIIQRTLPEGSMDLSTIYRSLEAFYEAGLISKSTVDGTSYYHLNKKGHHHYIMCLGCKMLVELDCHLDAQIHKIEEQSDFKIVQHDLTFYGYCPTCEK